MMATTILLAAIAFLCVDARINEAMQSRRQCWSAGNDQQARWWDEGARVDRGRYWYECRNGQLMPRGCFSETNERIFIDGTYVTNNYEMQCVLNADGYLQFKFTACVPDGVTRYHAGDSWEESRHMYYYECQQDGPYLKVEIAGCLSHDKSRRLKLGEQYDFGDYTYQCLKKYNGSVQMCSVGCIHNGVHHKVGDQWPDGEFLYYCKLNGGRCQKICVGCQFRNKRLYDGDRYHKDETVYQCEVRPDKYGHKAVGCVVHDDNGETIERVIGCKWYKTTKNSKVEQTCVLEDSKTVIKTLGCIYVHKGYDTLFLYPGTYTIWTQSMDGTSLGVVCRTGDMEGPVMETFQMSEIAFKTQGLKYDQPRG